MSTATEFEIKVSGGRITNAIVMPDGSCKLVMEVENPVTKCTASVEQQSEFVRIPASELSLEQDWFKKFKPKTENEKKFYEQLREVIPRGVKDFYRPKYDPSFNQEGTGICYVSGKKPAVGESYNWWAKTAKKFKPECKSRLGTKSEYIAFLAVLIKSLVASGWSIAKAWNAVCNDSKELGHYCNSENAKHTFEDTESREICGFCDLANTYKILAEDEEAGGFWLAGGYYNNFGNFFPLAGLYHNFDRNYDIDFSVGWLVLECSTDH